MPVELVALLPLLTTAVTKIADGTLKKVGEGLYNKAINFFDKLRGATKDSPEDAKTLRSFEALPVDYGEEMRGLLERHLKSNASLQEAAKHLLADSDAPKLLVRLEATEAEKQLGASDLEMSRGSADLGLKAGKVKDQVGVGKAKLS